LEKQPFGEYMKSQPVPGTITHVQQIVKFQFTPRTWH